VADDGRPDIRREAAGVKVQRLDAAPAGSAAPGCIHVSSASRASMVCPSYRSFASVADGPARHVSPVLTSCR